MVKGLVEAGVDPSHTDYTGHTAYDKAKLYGKTDVMEYLQKAMQDKSREYKDWSKIPVHHSGMFRTRLDWDNY